jgi:hypothetical protein
MGGNGPLLELATLKEYLPDLRPRIVLWQFFENDPADLRGESAIALLRRYLEEKDFRQGIPALQDAIAAEQRKAAPVLERSGRRWPKWLATAGITRARTPLWIQDLITGQDQTRTARIVRLHGWNVSLARLVAPPAKVRAEVLQDVLLERILREAHRTVASWGGELYLVYIPSYGLLKDRGHETPPLRVPVLEMARSLGIPYVDLYPVLQAHPTPLSSLFPYPHAHYNEEGYRVAAEGIVAGLSTAKSSQYR